MFLTSRGRQQQGTCRWRSAWWQAGQTWPAASLVRRCQAWLPLLPFLASREEAMAGAGGAGAGNRDHLVPGHTVWRRWLWAGKSMGREWSGLEPRNKRMLNFYQVHLWTIGGLPSSYCPQDSKPFLTNWTKLLLNIGFIMPLKPGATLLGQSLTFTYHSFGLMEIWQQGVLFLPRKSESSPLKLRG